MGSQDWRLAFLVTTIVVFGVFKETTATPSWKDYLPPSFQYLLPVKLCNAIFQIALVSYISRVDAPCRLRMTMLTINVHCYIISLFVLSKRKIAMIIIYPVEHETDLSLKRASGRLNRSVEVCYGLFS